MMTLVILVCVYSILFNLCVVNDLYLLLYENIVITEKF